MNRVLTEPNRRFAAIRLSDWTASQSTRVIAFLLLHIPLGIALAQSRALGAAHALLVLMIGLWWAATSPRIENAAYIAAYLTGAETLWRMTQTPLFWEFSKYALVLIFTVAIVRTGRFRGRILPFLYFLLLLPSIILPMINVDTGTLRNHLSFNLSGPLALMISTWFFSQITLTFGQLQRVFFALIGPALSIGFIALSTTLSASTIFFSNNSNFVTSGGFGPNQVSAALGLGALLCFLSVVVIQTTRGLKAFMFALMIFLAVQSAMTFSRSGLYTAAASVALASFYLFRSSQTRLKMIAGIGLLMLITNFVLLPKLDEFTGGALSRRFTNTKLTGRDRIAQADFQIWMDNPVFGVGPGQAKEYREGLNQKFIAHTEFSRMLAEHGLFGLAAMVILLAIALQNLRQARSPGAKAMVVSMTGWSFLFMLGSAMRLVAPSLTFGLAAANIAADENMKQ